MCDLSANGIKFNSEKKQKQAGQCHAHLRQNRPPDATMQKR